MYNKILMPIDIIQSCILSFALIKIVVYIKKSLNLVYFQNKLFSTIIKSACAYFLETLKYDEQIKQLIKISYN